MIRKLLLNLLAIFAMIGIVKSQEAKPDAAAVSDVIALKAGFIGAWFSYEKSLTRNLSLTTEIGYEGGLTGGNGQVDYILTSSLSLEPKYYYNFFNRVKKGKNVNNNSANYVSLDFLYIPDLLTSSKNNNVNVSESFSIVPKWGLRRSISTKLFFDFAFGVGYAWGENNRNEATAGLDLRIGYSF